MANGEYGDFTSVTVKVWFDLKQVSVEGTTADGRGYLGVGGGAESKQLLRTVAEELMRAYVSKGADHVTLRIDKNSGRILSGYENRGGQAMSS